MANGTLLPAVRSHSCPFQHGEGGIINGAYLSDNRGKN